jgi:hypothetical protein
MLHAHSRYSVALFATGFVFAAALPAHAARVTVEGRLEISFEESRKSSRLVYEIRNEKTGRVTRLLLPDASARLRSGDRLRVKGQLAEDTLFADVGGAEVVQAAASANVLPNTLGPHRVLVILVNFQDKATQPITPAAALEVISGVTSDYFRENSFGQTSLSADVYGWYTIPLSSTGCDTTAIANYADQAAAAAGAVLSNYQHIMYEFPQNACSFTGRAGVGSARSWINEWFELGIVGHELGHNYGLFHSRSLDCGTQVIGTSCTVSEYGDTFDLMGGAQSSHFNAFQKERLGWLGAGVSPPIAEVAASGTFRLDPYATPGSGPKALKILKSVDAATGQRTWYYLERRTAFGFDAALAAWAGVNSVLVRTGTDGNPQATYLLDLTPETDSWFDAGLAAGKSFADAAAGVAITTVSADETGATVQVSLTGPPPGPSPSPSPSPAIDSQPPSVAITSPANGAIVSARSPGR